VRDGINWFVYVGNNPLVMVDPSGTYVVQQLAFELMTDFVGVKLGNSSSVLANHYGCYVASLGNAVGTADLIRDVGSDPWGFAGSNRDLLPAVFSDDAGSRIADALQEEYGRFEELNDRSELFPPGSQYMRDRQTAMDLLFGPGGNEDGNWDYWTREKQGTEGLRDQIERYEESERAYALVGIFDISSVVPDATTHMVGILGEPDASGVFDPDAILGSSYFDRLRLSSEAADVYRLANLVEIRVIDVERYNEWYQEQMSQE
jgi:hypothetical protein